MDAFFNRITKVNRHIAKWAKRQNVTCYRIYDADIPEFPLCIDRYHEYAHIAVYHSKHANPEDETYDEWLHNCLQIVSEVLQIRHEKIFVKERKKLARRTEQYEKVSEESKTIIVTENGLQFKVNLTDYLDTGLFLDHRPLRQKFKEEAKGLKVLNLFAYTGAFSVYAAAGGAAEVTTVDMSATYINWSKENFTLNNIDLSKHRFIQSDTMQFLKSLTDERYDLVFVDPPAFSNSKKMKGTWDTQRDHPALLHIILQVLNPGGKIYFSNNLRSFQADFKRLSAKQITDISLKTIPEDFRNQKIHYCFEILK